VRKTISRKTWRLRRSLALLHETDPHLPETLSTLAETLPTLADTCHTPLREHSQPPGEPAKAPSEAWNRVFGRLKSLAKSPKNLSGRSQDSLAALETPPGELESALREAREAPSEVRNALGVTTVSALLSPAQSGLPPLRYSFSPGSKPGARDLKPASPATQGRYYPAAAALVAQGSAAILGLTLFCRAGSLR
jgi:hypothetical protein